MNCSSKKMIVAVLALLCIFTGCEKDRGNQGPETPQPEVVEVGANSEAIINAAVMQQGDGFVVNLSDVPEKGALQCELNGMLLDECYDGMQLPAVAAGNHRLTVRSLISGETWSFGEVRFFHEVVSGSGTNVPAAPVIADKHPLHIKFAQAPFRNGSAVKVTDGLRLVFSPFKKPPCSKPVLRCRYDSIDSPFWPKCSSALGHAIDKSRMATGLQYLSIRAECGSSVGPNLGVYWYGVRENYQSLQADIVKISNKKLAFRLHKANDCPAEWLSFECKAPSANSFAGCDATAEISRFVKGSQVRAKCREQKGPPNTYQP